MIWKKRTGEEVLYDGDRLIVALRIVDNRDQKRCYWSIETIVVRCDEDYFTVENTCGDIWGWSWEDVEYWMPARDLEQLLPMANEELPA